MILDYVLSTWATSFKNESKYYDHYLAFVESLLGLELSGSIKVFLVI